MRQKARDSPTRASVYEAALCSTLRTMAKAAVLVVEDDATIGESLAAVLGNEGYDVRLAIDAAGALARAEEATPEVVLLDLGLPDADGLTVCRQLPRTVRGGEDHRRDGPGGRG